MRAFVGALEQSRLAICRGGFILNTCAVRLKADLTHYVLRGPTLPPSPHRRSHPFQRLISPVYTGKPPPGTSSSRKETDYFARDARIRNAAAPSRAIETSARIRAHGATVALPGIADPQFTGLFSPGSPRADGWITRKLFRSGRLVAFTLRRNAPHNSRLSFFVRPAPRPRSPFTGPFRADRTPYVLPEENIALSNARNRLQR